MLPTQTLSFFQRRGIQRYRILGVSLPATQRNPLQTGQHCRKGVVVLAAVQLDCRCAFKKSQKIGIFWNLVLSKYPLSYLSSLWSVTFQCKSTKFGTACSLAIAAELPLEIWKKETRGIPDQFGRLIVDWRNQSFLLMLIITLGVEVWYIYIYIYIYIEVQAKYWIKSKLHVNSWLHTHYHFTLHCRMNPKWPQQAEPILLSWLGTSWGMTMDDHGWRSRS